MSEMKWARGRTRTCQEASSASITMYVACDRPATCIVDNGDQYPYFMCDECADHNVKNRGAHRYTRSPLQIQRRV